MNFQLKQIHLYLGPFIALTLLAFIPDLAHAQTAPIQIKTCQDLQNIGQITAEPLTGSYVLANNVDCTASYSWNSGHGFAPIGTGLSPATSFSGTFDGAGYTISNVYINDSVTKFGGYVAAGLFGGIEAATIKNVNVSNIDIETTYFIYGIYQVGGLVGADLNGSTPSVISNVTVSGKLSGLYVGGIIGSSMNVQISQSSFIGSIEGSYVGGLDAAVTGYLNISNSFAKATLVSIPWNPGSPAPSPNTIGGIIGIISAPSSTGITLTNSYSASSFSFPAYPAGESPVSTVQFGGLIGYTKFPINSIVTNSFFDNQYGRQGISDISPLDPLGLSTIAMKIQSTYTNWDFQSTWGILADVDYPYLLHTIVTTVAPVITSQPVSVTLTSAGQGTAQFSVTATSVPFPTFQWQLSTDGGNTFNNAGEPFTAVISTATSGYSISAGNISAYNGYEYRCVITNGVSPAVTSNVATIIVSVTSISPDGSTLSPSSSGNLVTSAGTWTFSTATGGGGNDILLNGQSAAGGTAVLLLVYNSGHLYAESNAGKWYEWSGSGWSSVSADPRPATVPPVPTNLTATVISSSQINLKWTISTGATGYEIFRGGTQVGTSTSASYSNTGLTPSTTYSYTVLATNTAGSSAQSSAVTATTPAGPAISPDGTSLAAGATGSLVTSAGTWTFSTATGGGGNDILLNGQSAAGGTAVLLLVYNSGHLYAKSNAGSWYEWTGSGWLTALNFNPSATLTITYTGAAQCDITSTPAGINCSNNSSAAGTCSAQFPIGSTVQLQAQEGSGIFSWDGLAGCVDNPGYPQLPNCSLVMKGNLVVPAQSTK